ncbi:biotin-independent malonate decarboxylase subunit beta [Vibrio palustris]|uniref:Malonate decarboxylase acyl carrier protein n=1 Tax=Vibrio palustris TaxID=1918946 RepID=A0A1R4B5N8_9VIBR|nr:biotin-independent malonate decarboxylase subunit beta [Vibrio palustris]SJL84247.1 Malonyl-S-ACP:biotin-protein carboxyltransferase MADC [Vibrio palustris]
MEQLTFSYAAHHSIDTMVRVGNVGSGDLEILLEPTDQDTITIELITSIDNRQPLWDAIFQRQFADGVPAMQITINDFGATPGVIGLRLVQALEQITTAPARASANTLGTISFIEMGPRERAKFLLDAGTFREVMGNQHHSFSPWLVPQGIVPQSDDGCVVAKGTIDGKPSVVVGIDGTFQGGAIGEISGAKMAAALELALKDAKAGHPTQVILLLETGGVRLQEANLGLAAIADIHAGIVALRDYVPVIGVVAGAVGCFGGMSIAAGLCSKVIVTQEARLGLNGPQVIEQEAGIEEYDSRNRPFIWSFTGGEARFASRFADVFSDDDAHQIRSDISNIIHQPLPASARCEQVETFLSVFNQIDTAQQATPALVRHYFTQGECK